MQVGNQIKKYRDQLHLSQEQLAEEIYVTRQTISNWETKDNIKLGNKYPDFLKIPINKNIRPTIFDDNWSFLM